jgi:hypothetical protein
MKANISKGEITDRSRAREGLGETVTGVVALRRDVQKLTQKADLSAKLVRDLDAAYVKLRRKLRETAIRGLGFDLVLSPEYLERQLSKIDFGAGSPAGLALTNLEVVFPTKSHGPQPCTRFGMDQIGVRASAHLGGGIPDMIFEFGLGLSFGDRRTGQGRFYLARDAYECTTTGLGRSQLKRLNSLLRGKINDREISLPAIIPGEPGLHPRPTNPVMPYCAEVDASVIHIYYYDNRLNGGYGTVIKYDGPPVGPAIIDRIDRLPDRVQLAAKSHVAFFEILINTALRASGAATNLGFPAIIGPVIDPPGFVGAVEMYISEIVCTHFEVHIWPLTNMRAGCAKWEKIETALPVFFQCSLIKKRVEGVGFELWGRIELGGKAFEQKIAEFVGATNMSLAVDENSVMLFLEY